MVDVLTERPVGIETWRPAQTGVPIPLSRKHVVERIEGVSGLPRIRLDTPAFLGRPAPELRVGSGTGQAGLGIGKARPIAPQPFAEPTPVFIVPGGVRI